MIVIVIKFIFIYLKKDNELKVLKVFDKL